MIEVVKLALRISNTAFDTEINDLISAARHDLMLSGITSIKANDDADPLVKRAIITYCKANFGWDNPDSERLNQSYDMLKTHLTLSQEYNAYSVTFTVTDGTNPLEDAIITFNGQEKYTDSTGKSVFTGVEKAQNMDYSVTLDGYQEFKGTIDVDGNETVSVTLVVA